MEDAAYRTRWITLLIVVMLASALGSGNARAQSSKNAARIYPILGVRWFELTDSELREFYGGGPGFAAGLGVRLGNRLSAEAELEWFRGSGDPSAPPFVAQTSSTLTLLPISAMLRYQVAARPDGLFLLIGPALVRQTESFSYSLLEGRDSVSGALTGVGLSVGLGWEATRRPLAYRVVARAILGSAKRTILREGAPRLETEETIASSLIGLGLEVRLP